MYLIESMWCNSGLLPPHLPATSYPPKSSQTSQSLAGSVGEPVLNTSRLGVQGQPLSKRKYEVTTNGYLMQNLTETYLNYLKLQYLQLMHAKIFPNVCLDNWQWNLNVIQTIWVRSPLLRTIYGEVVSGRWKLSRNKRKTTHTQKNCNMCMVWNFGFLPMRLAEMEYSRPKFMI